jgi:hypothetical protein
MRHIIRYTLLLILFCVLHHSVEAQISESEIEAAYIERFTRFVEWSDDAPNNTTKTVFVITVLGENTFGSSLDNLFKELKIKNLPVSLKYTHHYNEVVGSDIVIICHSERKRLQKILEFINSKPILIISDSEGFAEEGTHINMYVDNSNIRYEINQDEIKKTGLKVSSLLLSSAKIVKTDD